MTLRLTDEQTAALRAQAEVEQRSMQTVAQEAIREYLDRHARRARLDEELSFVTDYYADVFRRLTDH